MEHYNPEMVEGLIKARPEMAFDQHPVSVLIHNYSRR